MKVMTLLSCLAITQTVMAASPLGLPPVPVPAGNPQTPEKIALGDKLFNDQRFSATGDVSCATCHDAEKAFTDSPLSVSEGINKLTGTRNAPTVVNAAYNQTQFWDGRSPDLEDQALHPFTNPVEMALPNHEPLLSQRPWEREHFVAHHLDEFLAYCHSFHGSQARRLGIAPVGS